METATSASRSKANQVLEVVPLARVVSSNQGNVVDLLELRAGRVAGGGGHAAAQHHGFLALGCPRSRGGGQT